jgi:hypothetical protein
LLALDAPDGASGYRDFVAMVHVNEGRVVGQWIQFDLWGIYQQLTSPTPEPLIAKAAEPAIA